MINEAQTDLNNGTLFFGATLSEDGKQKHPELLIKSFKIGDEDTLANS